MDEQGPGAVSDTEHRRTIMRRRWEGWQDSDVQMSDWLSTVIAGIALIVSGAVAVDSYRRNRRLARTAELTAYFHWNREKSRVDLPDRKIHVGYNLVIWNQGPDNALDVHLEVHLPGAEAVRLVSIEDGEFPLARVDTGGKYPIQFAPDLTEFYESADHPMVRRFDVLLHWRDRNGRHKKTVPLRRGQTDQ